MPDAAAAEAPGEATAVILARMEVKLDHALANVTDHESRIRVLEDHQSPEITDHETRLRSVERKIWTASGFAGVTGAGLTAVALAIIKALGG